MTGETEPKAAAPTELVVTRRFAAPRELVFKAWSSAEHIKRWFSPEDCTTPAAEIDFRVGGVFAVCMRLPDGVESWSRGRFDEIVAPERLAFTSTVTFGDSAPLFTAHTSVAFAQDGDGTRMTVRQRYDIHDARFADVTQGANEGWRTTLDKLEREVARIKAGG
ncbi:MAG TPA: SRPBCC domain-containing protein [Hyphomicrobiales bacterium]|nr:SRPBCC domain-containing protein [Hyphomicrobiales bacterium]